MNNSYWEGYFAGLRASSKESKTNTVPLDFHLSEMKRLEPEIDRSNIAGAYQRPLMYKGERDENINSRHGSKV
jgi:hypothetical protein